MYEFEKAATTPIIIFEIVAIIASATMIFFLSKLKSKILIRFGTVAIGVLIFEMFTAPMWHNIKLGEWAYLYKDVSWILTVGWSAMILSVVVLTDHYLRRLSQPVRFGVYLIALTLIVLVAEYVVQQLGIRQYSEEVKAALVGVYIGGVPIEVGYYVAVFTSLIIGFYKYWSFKIDDELMVPVIKIKWLRKFLLALIAVLLFELMIEPMVVNTNFPSWSYIYRDITFLMTGLWIVIIWITTMVIDRYLLSWDLLSRFMAYLVVLGLAVLPIESWFINNGYRVYGQSAADNFSGFTTPITGVPIEVAFAIPLYMALIISFIRFWEISLDNGNSNI